MVIFLFYMSSQIYCKYMLSWLILSSFHLYLSDEAKNHLQIGRHFIEIDCLCLVSGF